jgi:arylsulfatase A-like enzyme
MDVAPTILSALGVRVPEDMRGTPIQQTQTQTQAMPVSSTIG